MEEYIRKLLEQVRFKNAHKSIEGEIRSHIEDQIADNMSAGMERAEAEKAAVEDMGDPVEVGISMDRIHRPRVAWSVIIIAVLIGIASSVIHELMVLDASAHDLSISVIGSHVFYTNILAGLIAMILIYMIDYTVIAKYAKIIAAVMFLILLLGRLGITFNGVYMYLTIGPVRFLTKAFMLLYAPIYGAIIYKYRGGGFLAFAKALMWMIIPALFVLRWPSYMTALVLTMTMAVQLTIAVIKGWFKIPKKLTVTALWLSITVLPISLIYLLYQNGFLRNYQMERIRAFIYLDSDAAYITKTVRSFSTVSIVGDSGKEILGNLPNPNSDFLLLYLANKYGLMIVLAIVATVATIIITGCIASSKSKNQLGLVMGIGCMNVLMVNLIMNMFQNIGALPYADSFMPFFSAGGSNIVLAYIFLGIVLSIYKYKDAYPQHVDTRIRGKIKLGNIEIMKD